MIGAATNLFKDQGTLVHVVDLGLEAGGRTNIPAYRITHLEAVKNLIHVLLLCKIGSA